MNQITTTCIVGHRENGKHLESEKRAPLSNKSKHQKNKGRSVSTRILVNVPSVGSIKSMMNGTERWC